MKNKYVVPTGMSQAVRDKYSAYGTSELVPRLIIQAAIQTAIQWLAENPIIPTEDQLRELVKAAPLDHKFMIYSWAISEWQRRMFLAPEPAVPVRIENVIRGYTFSKEQADSIKQLVDQATRPE